MVTVFKNNLNGRFVEAAHFSENNQQFHRANKWTYFLTIIFFLVKLDGQLIQQFDGQFFQNLVVL